MRSPDHGANDVRSTNRPGDKIWLALLGLLATTTLHASVGAFRPDRSHPGPLLQLIVPLVVLFAWLGPARPLLRMAVRRRVSSGQNGPVRTPALRTAMGWLAVAAVPWPLDALSTHWWDQGDLSEVVLAYALQNLIWAQIWAGTPSALVVVSSLFLVMYSFLWTCNRTTTMLLILYGMVALSHLATSYWQTLHPQRPIDKIEFSGRPMGLFWTTVGLLLLAPLLVWQSAAASTSGLPGWLSSSGGQDASDPRASRGIGSGDQLVAAQHNAMSFGPIETELFIESEMPTLYDAYSESYEPPVPKRRQSTRRAIPLAPNDIRTSHEQRSVNQAASREFTAHRQPRETADRPDDVRVAALFHVKGRVPVHLGIETFNHWDGTSLSHVPETSVRNTAVLSPPDRDGRRWLAFQPPTELMSWEQAERHTLRIANLRTARVPAPPRLRRLQVDRLSDAGVFRIEDDGHAAYCGDSLPQLTVLHIESWGIRQADCRSLDFSRRQVEHDQHHDEHHDQLVGRLARRWVVGRPAGWPQIEAVVDGLRAHAALDPQSAVPPSAEDAVEYFLGTSRRGADYLFATAAALMFRHLGYESRVISGFYASARGYDARSGQTAVMAHDVHFWTEVRLVNGSWMAVDATPGYEQPFAAPNWQERCQQALLAAIRSAQRHAIPLVLGSCLAVWSLVQRRRIISLLALAGNSLPFPRRSLRAEVTHTLRLIHAISLWHGHPRPAQLPWGRWLHCQRDWWEPFAARGDRQLSSHQWASVVQWALYCPQSPCPLNEADVRRACRTFPWNAYRAFSRRSRRHPATTSSIAASSIAASNAAPGI